MSSRQQIGCLSRCLNMDLIFDIMSKRNPYQGVPNKPASILTIYDFSESSFQWCDMIYWFDIESISMSQVWDLSIWWFARLLHCKAFAAFWNLTKELLVWNLGFGRSPEISGELPCWYLTSNDCVDEFRVIGHDWPMEITSITMEMAQIRPVSLQFSTQECGNRERQFLRNSGQLAKMIFANICYTYIRKWIHMCMIMWHTWHIDRLTVPFLNQYTYDYICN